VLVAAVLLIPEISIARAKHRAACDGDIIQATAADPYRVLRRIFHDRPNFRDR